MRLRPTLSEDGVQYYKEKAQEEFPALGPDESLAAYAELHRAKDLFFHDKDGKRCVWREDLSYSANLFFGLKEIQCGRNIYYYRWPNTKKLASVDRPKNPELVKIVAHPSEAAWNLPTKHERHFLKFPPEILNTILRYVLLLRSNEELRPLTNTSNLKKECQLPDYETYSKLGHQDYRPETRGPFMTWVDVQDDEGSYTELRNVYRKPIDATLLRVNRFFNRIGRSMLYGSNVFLFGMTSKYWKRTPAYCRTVGKRNFLHKPNPMKPSWREATLDGTITKGIDAIRQGALVYKLPGWLYYDRFLRFLHTIGPKNAALIRSLKFRGVVMLHTCSGEESHERCEEDLVQSLRFYMPFIKELCIGLESLVIEYVCGLHYNEPSDAPNHQATEDSLRPLLEQEIMQIRTLRDLQVIQSNIRDDAACTPKFAELTITQVSDRTKARNAAASKWDAYILKIKTEREQKATLKDTIDAEQGWKPMCGFCGEEHISAECWNLCNFCGEFGHFRKGCLRAEEY